MDEIARLEQEIAALEQQRQSIIDLRDSYNGLVAEVRRLNGALRMVNDVLTQHAPPTNESAALAMQMIDDALRRK
mgnify:CR=1 FL=1